MPNYISQSDYVAIAESYAAAKVQLENIKELAWDAVYDVAMLQTVIPEVDLIRSFYDSYLENFELSSNNTTFIDSVRDINNHVLNRSDFDTLDEYLQDTGSTIPQEWADLSTSAGFTITEIA